MCQISERYVTGICVCVCHNPSIIKRFPDVNESLCGNDSGHMV